jgi:hypothetical protein
MVRALDKPIIFGNLTVPPHPGNNPSFVSGKPIFVLKEEFETR